MLDELAPLHAQIDPAYPDNLRQIAEVLFAQLVVDAPVFLAQNPGEALPPQRLNELAFLALRLSDRVSHEMGGEAIYIGKGVAYRATLRDREMYALYQNGATVKALAHQFGVSVNWVRRVCNAMTAVEREQRQGKLELG